MPTDSGGEAREDQLEPRRRHQTRLGARSKATLGAGTVLGATVLFAPQADAATFTVTSLADDGSDGTLRHEIEDANATDGDDTIIFQSGLSGTITLTGAQGGDIEIHNDGLDIQGPGAAQIAISGDDLYRIFDIYGFDEPDKVSISGLTLTDGHADDGGAVVSRGPGPYLADVTVAGCVITGNEATHDGGALYLFYGSESIIDSQITNNSAVVDGGGVRILQGGGDGAPATGVVISNSVISGNDAGDDGGGANLYFSTSDVIVENSTISGNSADSLGGGVTLYGNYDGISTTIRGTTISGNYAGNYAGGLGLFGSSSATVDPGPTLIENSTVSGNSAAFYAGGIGSYNPDDNARTIRNSTIVDNRAAVNPAASGTYQGGGVYALFLDNPGQGADVDNLELQSTIVANNSPDDLGGDISEGAFVAGFDLIEAAAGANIVESPAGSNITGLDPQLGPLENNGGPTETRLPALTSPAVDAGIANGLTTDQRGLARTAEISSIPNRAGSDGTDIGAVEIQSAECQGALVPAKTGTDADETIAGTDGPDSIAALGGNDAVNALAADDCASGGAGADDLDGGDGNDLLDGGAGDDSASGGAGDDGVTTAAGADTLSGDDGNDRLDGGDDDDSAFGGAGDDTLSGAAGKDSLKGDAGKDKLAGDAGRDRARGGAGKDRLTGADGNDTLNGDAGKDTVIGGAGKDRIKGGNAKDLIKGNGGKDKINSIDGKVDKVNCGGGEDTAKVDDIDKVSKNCDAVKVKSD